MDVSQFVDMHAPALSRDEIKYNLPLGIMAAWTSRPSAIASIWTLGNPGACALQSKGYPIILGDVSEAQARALARETVSINYPGVVGSDETAPWFASEARTLGIVFDEPIPQAIKVLDTIPSMPNTSGSARLATPEDFEIFRAWTHAFIEEAVPTDPRPTDDALRSSLATGRYRLWTMGDNAVSLAAIARRSASAGTINSVYTPPHHRNRGFAAALTATIARELLAEGRRPCLYTDLRNMASNRCYEKIGFKSYCKSWHIPRAKNVTASAG